MSSGAAPQTPPNVFALARFFRPYQGRITLLLVTALGSAVLSACEPLLYKSVFDAFTGGDVRQVALPLVALVVAMLGREVLAVRLDTQMWRVRIAANFDLLRETIDRLHSLPLSVHRSEGVGATMTKVERGISGAMSAFSELALNVVPSIVYLCVSAFVMLRLEWRLAVVVVAFAPLPALIGWRASKEQTQRERELMARWTRLFARLNEVLSGIAVVKSFVREEDEKRRFLGGVADANAIVVRGVSTDARTALTKNVVMACARALAIALGGWFVVRHEISLGTLVAFLGYVAGVFMPVQALTGVYQSVRKGAVSAEAVVSILDAQDALGDAPNARELGHIAGRVTFERVSFSYRPGAPTLSDVSLEVVPGETIALVGASGAGKSTMMALLQRLYDPTSGRILVDGEDIRAYKQRSLRGRIGVVLQDGMLFDDTIRDNILFGNPRATQAQVEAAARAANAHDFIMALPDGYDTRVGERGSKLSGGERQRIAIARAVLKDAPILILDEATSALDAESEDAVREALARLRRGRTTFVIAHRLSTVTEADRIAVFRGGRIVEIGRHPQLLRMRGQYAQLVARQTRGLIDAA